ncbi:MAG: ornithine cyclodeaminase family protein [Cyclobacteriaceae bacterium]
MKHPDNSSLILSGSDVEAIVRHCGLDELMDTCISRLNAAIQAFDPNQTIIPVRAGFHYEQPQNGLIEWMPMLNSGDQVMMKVVGYHPANPIKHDLPTILSTISAFDTDSGHLLGMVDGVLLTALRTGAASAVASSYLAHPDSKTLGIIGCGTQAITQLHGLSRVLELEKVLIYDLSPQATMSFADRASVLGLQVEIIPTNIHEVVSKAEILVTATSIEVGAGPLFENQETKPFLHINAVGSDFPGKLELPSDLLTQSFVCPDFLEQALLEGECQQLQPEQIGPEWVEIIQDSEAYTHLKLERTIFDSTGWPLEDFIVMEIFLEYARELGLGQEIAVELLPDDAKNPYHFLKEIREKVMLKAT